MLGAGLRRLRARSLALASLNINGELARRLNNDILYASALICGGGQGGDNLPLPVPRSPASRTFLFLCLPTPALLDFLF